MPDGVNLPKPFLSSSKLKSIQEAALTTLAFIYYYPLIFNNFFQLHIVFMTQLALYSSVHDLFYE